MAATRKIIVALALLLVASPAMGQTKKKKKKKKKDQPAATEPATPEDETAPPSAASPPPTPAQPTPAPATPVAPPRSSNRLFPKWERRGFDWDIAPILAFKAGTNTSGGTTTTSTSAETGVRAGLKDIPLIPGNPGAGAGVKAGVAFGDTAAVTTIDETGEREKSNVKYQRVFGGVSATGYYKFVKQELGFEKAKLEYDDKVKTVVQQIGVDHDLGLLVMTWLSAHHTLNYSRAFNDQASEPFLVMQDHWLHTRIFTDFLQFAFDLGPGATFADEYGYDTAGKHEKQATGRTDYFQMLTRFHIFWKLGASGRAKYIYNSSEEKLGGYSGVRLPGDDLDQPSSVTQPEDSFQGSFFLGISDLFYRISVGWRYNVEISNLSEKDGKKKSVTRDSGFGAGFQAAL